jgi:hypothetical protein
MPKVLAAAGMAISAILLLLFGLDLAIAFPFGGLSGVMDIGFVVCSALLAYLSWSTFREQV